MKSKSDAERWDFRFCESQFLAFDLLKSELKHASECVGNSFEIIAMRLLSAVS
jgi:hypothetical protein